jgi:hypothetical protein
MLVINEYGPPVLFELFVVWGFPSYVVLSNRRSFFILRYLLARKYSLFCLLLNDSIVSRNILNLLYLFTCNLLILCLEIYLMVYKFL